MLEIVWQSRFKKDFKIAVKRNKDLSKLDFLINELRNLRPLPAKYNNHKLKGNYSGCWECHIESDWLLIYFTTETKLVLVRNGTHSDLF